MHLPQTALMTFVSLWAQPSDEWELMYDSKGTGMGFIGVIRGGFCGVQEKSVPTCIRESRNKSSAGFDHCTSCYQLSLLGLALQDSREEPAADKECSSLPCRALGGEQAGLSGLEHMAPWNGGHGEVQSKVEN